jgi:hypothetical protein
MYVTIAPNVRKYIGDVPPGMVMVMLPSELRSYGSIMFAHVATFWPKLLVSASAGAIAPRPTMAAMTATAPDRAIQDILALPLYALLSLIAYTHSITPPVLGVR